MKIKHACHQIKKLARSLWPNVYHDFLSILYCVNVSFMRIFCILLKSIRPHDEACLPISCVNHLNVLNIYCYFVI